LQCNAKLMVTKNTNSKKAGESGTSYKLSLLNRGIGEIIYTISVQNSIAEKSKENTNEVKLEGHLYNMNLKRLSNKTSSKNLKSSYSIKLNQGETFDFYVKLKVPLGTKFGSRNRTNVIVTTKKCINFSVSTILITEIIDGE